MHLRIAIPESQVTPHVLDAASEAVTRLNEQMMRQGLVGTFDQALAAGRVRWQPEPPGEERFDHASLVTGRGWGDCDDLAPWHAASLRVTGEDPGARARVFQSGPKRFHDVVERSDGSIDDPSLAAGMPRPKGHPPAVTGMLFPHRRPAVAVLPSTVAGGYYARADLPWVGSSCNIVSSCHGSSPEEALSEAIAGACYVGEAAKIVDREHVAHLLGLEALMRGAHPDDVAMAVAGHGIHLNTHVLGDLARTVCGVRC